MENEAETLIRQIFEDAERYGIRAYQIAERAGISANGVSYWRSGRTKPSLVSYLKVRKAADDLIMEKVAKA
jgi:transcriptional regulator with XRE-family HTH domain